ncbi:unnamed protein product [Chrysodeixis includens]|uniref:Uncharacterized protein n=1 Tax=Chrysodeixis includens TaxID=689277 RepID=A0A9P0FT02_CHRIL|nr:unnamed protein product [Chrysodeixis includens]
MAAFVTNLDIFMFLRVAGDLKNWERLYETIILHIPVETCSEDLEIIKTFLKNYISNINRRWASAYRNQKTFINRHAAWLQSNISWPNCTTVNLTEIFQGQDEVIETISSDNTSVDIDTTAAVIPSTSSITVGTSTKVQIRKPFVDLSNKQKKRRSESLLDYSPEELTFALVERLKIDQKNDLACVIDHITKNPDSVPIIQATLFKKNRNRPLAAASGSVPT